MKVAFVYNPYQLLIIAGLTTLDSSIKRLIIPKRIQNLARKLVDEQYVEIICLSDSFVSDGRWNKLKATMKNITIFQKFRCDELFISNDQSILFLICLKIVKIKTVTLIDEGALEQLLLRERASKETIVQFLKGVVIGRAKRGRHKKIKAIIVHDPDRAIWMDFQPERKIVSAQTLAFSGLERLSIFEKHISLKNKFVLVTSPLTENGNSKFKNQELKIIEKVLQNNQDKTFILKKHYRESSDKYDHLVQRYQNLEYMDAAYDDFPIQILFNNIEKMVGFHSSAVSQFGSKNPQNAISMSSLVGTLHAEEYVKTQPFGVRFLDTYVV